MELRAREPIWVSGKGLSGYRYLGTNLIAGCFMRLTISPYWIVESGVEQIAPAKVLPFDLSRCSKVTPNESEGVRQLRRNMELWDRRKRAAGDRGII